MRTRNSVALSLPILLLTCIVLAASVRAQDQVTLHFGDLGSQPPIKILQVLLDQHQVSTDTPIAVSGNWVSKLVVVVQNTSSKHVVAGDLILFYLDTGTGEPGSPIVSEASNLGRYAPTSFRQREGTTLPVPAAVLAHPEIDAPPGGTLRFEFGPAAGGGLAQAQQNGVAIHRASLRLTSFYFADGSKWANNRYFLPIPAPELWRPVTPGQFFGNGAQAAP